MDQLTPYQKLLRLKQIQQELDASYPSITEGHAHRSALEIERDGIFASIPDAPHMGTAK